LLEPVRLYETKELEYTEDRETSDKLSFSASGELLKPAFRAGVESSVDEKSGEKNELAVFLDAALDSYEPCKRSGECFARE
jgi:hypothetical protein